MPSHESPRVNNFIYPVCLVLCFICGVSALFGPAPDNGMAGLALVGAVLSGLGLFICFAEEGDGW